MYACVWWAQVPEKVTQSAAHLLLSIMTTVRAAHIVEMSAVQNFYNQINQGDILALSIEVVLKKKLFIYFQTSHHKVRQHNCARGSKYLT